MTYIGSGVNGRGDEAPCTRVLVVDDSDQLAGLVGAWLEDEGYQVSTATSGSRALAAATATRPDVVLLDLILPPPDGFTVCDVLQRRPSPPLVIVMTGLTDPLRLRRLDEMGVFAVLQKPLTQDAVLDVVSRARRQRWDDTSSSAAS